MPLQFQNNFPLIKNKTPSRSPHHYRFLIVLIIILILTGIFGVYYFSNNLPEEETETADLKSTQGWVNYENKDMRIKFQYPQDFTLTKTENIIPVYNLEFIRMNLYTNRNDLKYSGIKIEHRSDAEHCNWFLLKEYWNCEPYTIDISVSFFLIPISIDEAVKETHNKYVSTVVIGEYKSESTEDYIGGGEGIDNYFISLGDKKTLWIRRSYIHEISVPHEPYKNVKDFIPYLEQIGIFQKILSTLEIEGIDN